MALPAIENYTDDKLSELLDAVLNEQERRRNVAQIPAQIAELRARFIDGGGDPAALDEETPAEEPAGA